MAAPQLHAGALVEIDAAAYEKDQPPQTFGDSERNGGVATRAPAAPSIAVETELPDDDEYEDRFRTD